MAITLEILYQDDCMVAINKPNGLLVHRSRIAADVSEFAVQILRDQLGKRVYPVHRLDRKTSGVLLFAFDREHTALLQQQLQDRQTQKIYWAIVRGYFPSDCVLHHPLHNEKGVLQAATTHFHCLQKVELPLPFGRYKTSRYSFIEARPQTGRMHQIRKHCNHLRHPIIGDRPHGCNKQNRLFKAQWQLTNMLLHAAKIELLHPVDKTPLLIKAGLPTEFVRMIGELGFEEVA